MNGLVDECVFTIGKVDRISKMGEWWMLPSESHNHNSNRQFTGSQKIHCAYFSIYLSTTCIIYWNVHAISCFIRWIKTILTSTINAVMPLFFAIAPYLSNSRTIKISMQCGKESKTNCLLCASYETTSLNLHWQMSNQYDCWWSWCVSVFFFSSSSFT